MSQRVPSCLAVAVLLLSAVSGCSAGGGRPGALPAPPSAPMKTTTATLRIVIPSHSSGAQNSARGPRYISPATQSISIVLTPTSGSATTVAQNLTPTSTGCQGSPSATVCVVPLGVVPGSYHVDLTMYDGLLDTHDLPQGRVLSATLGVPFTVSPGRTNALSITLNGMPATLAIIPAANATITGSPQTGYTLSRCFASEPAGTESVSVIGVDADGNMILGPGAPTPLLTSSDPSKIAVGVPSAGTPSTFPLSGSTPPSTADTVVLNASVTPLPGSADVAPVTAVVNVGFSPAGCPVRLTITSSPTSSVFGQAVTFTVQLAGAGATTGSLTLSANGAPILGCTALSNTNGGLWICTTTSLGAGQPSIIASYSDSADANIAYASSPYTQTVVGSSTSVVLSSDNNPSNFGQQVTFTASTSPVAPGAGSPTGSVAFSDTVSGATVSVGGCTAVPITAQVATCVTSALPVLAAGHKISARYNGDANYLASTSAQFSQTVNKAATGTALSVTPASAVSGQTVTLTALASSSSGATPSGSVQFLDGASNLGGPVALSIGAASISVAFSAGAPHSLTARYLGSQNFIGSTSSAVSLPVGKATPTIAIGSSMNPSTSGNAVTFTVTAGAQAPGAGLPTGTVTCFVDGTQIGVAQSLASGNATCNAAALTAGSHTITAAYGGDTQFKSQTSDAFIQAVN